MQPDYDRNAAYNTIVCRLHHALVRHMPFDNMVQFTASTPGCTALIACTRALIACTWASFACTRAYLFKKNYAEQNTSWIVDSRRIFLGVFFPVDQSQSNFKVTWLLSWHRTMVGWIVNIYDKLSWNIKCDHTALVDAQEQGVDARFTIVMQPATHPSQAPV
jgi:hypothetical protein